jgi:hypothetical protein
MNKAISKKKLANESQIGLSNYGEDIFAQNDEESLCSLFFDVGFKVTVPCKNIKL